MMNFLLLLLSLAPRAHPGPELCPDPFNDGAEAPCEAVAPKFQAAPQPPDPAPAAESPRDAILRSISGGRLREIVYSLAADEMEGRSPMTKGSERARRYVIGKMQESGLSPAGEDGFVQEIKSGDQYSGTIVDNVIGYNVIGYAPGKKNPDECVYVDAHYDHWGRAEGRIQPGANDNASGVAVMLELARAVARLELDRSVVFLASDYEEGALFPDGGGLKGAYYHAANPFCPRGKIKGAIVLDLVGGEFVPGLHESLFLFGSEYSPELYRLVAAMSSDKTAEVPVFQLGLYAIEPLENVIPNANYDAFRKHGVPFLFATSGVNWDYHTPGDTPEKLRYGFMERETRQLLRLVAHMASAEFSARFARRRVLDWNVEIGTVIAALERTYPGASIKGFLSSLREQPGARDAGTAKKTIKDAAMIIASSAMNPAFSPNKFLYRLRH